jgi:cell division protein FtsB
MNTQEEIDILETENDELKHKIKDLEYDVCEQQVKDDALWKTVEDTV